MSQFVRTMQIGALLAATLAAAAPSAAQDLGAMTQNPNQWVMPGRTYDVNRYSPLTQISTANVNRLVPAWTCPNGASSSIRLRRWHP